MVSRKPSKLGSLFLMPSSLFTCHDRLLSYPAFFRFSVSFTLFRLCQRDACQLLVVAGEDATIGEGGVAPDDVPIECEAGRFQQLCATEFFVPVRGEVGDDQITRFAREEVPAPHEQSTMRNGVNR